jgi:uncharacterized membrane protein YgcG
MKKRVVGLLALATVIFLFLPQKVFGQSFVKDDAGVLSAETVAKINQLNQEKFHALPGSPEYAVVTLKSLEGESIETVTDQLFEEYGFGNPDYNNGLVFVFAIEDREFRLGYGDGLSYLFSELSEEDMVDDDTKDLLREEDYDQAVLNASDRVYQEMKTADETIGLNKIYTEGQQLLAEKEAREAEKSREAGLLFLKIASSIILLVVAAISGTIGWRKYQTKKQFRAVNVIPPYIHSDPVFDEQAFYKWASKRKNYQTFNHYTVSIDCLKALKMYLLNQVIPNQLAEFERISPDPARKQMIQQALRNPQLADQYVQDFMKGHKNLKTFGKELAEGHETLRTYEAQLQRQLKEQLADYDLSKDILAGNAHLISKYKQKIQQLAQEEIQRRSRNNDYLAVLLTKEKTYPEMVQTSSQEITNLIEAVKTDALFFVDLQEVYKNHPDLKKQVGDFSRDDRVEVMTNARREYDPTTMDQSLVYLLLIHQVTRQEQVIADSQSSDSNFGGFGGGSSSGGGISGSW